MSVGKNKRILIAGAGLGGLAAAVALLQEGFEVALFEKSDELREVGAGLSVWPNATRVLKRLGLLEDALRRSQVLKCLRLQTWRGQLLSEVSVVGECDISAICIHRADLLAILKQQVPPECVHLGEQLVGFEQDEEGVVASFSSGRIAEGDALVGADGTHSTVRVFLLGESKPVYRGYQAWRGVAQCLPTTYPPTTAVESWGHGKRFGIESMGRGRTFWYATVNSPQGVHGDPAEWKDEVRELFKGWVRPIPEVIESTEPEAILKHEMEDRPPVRHWGRGRVTLLGDAAHLTTPNLGQGACMALEDALVLAQCLAQDDQETSAKLRPYESLRYARTAFLTRESKTNWPIRPTGKPLGRHTAHTRLKADSELRQPNAPSEVFFI